MVPVRSAETKSTVLEVERMDLRGRRQPVSVNFKITLEVPDVNYFAETIVPRGSEDIPGFSIQGQTLPNGKFPLKGLSPPPTKYRLRIDAPGHLPLNETLSLNRSTERFVLEEKIPIRIETILLKDGKFDLANLQEAWLFGGDDWKFNMPKPVPRPPGGPAMMGAMAPRTSNRPFTLGSGGMIQQAGGVLTFAVSGMTTSAKDLGEGTLQQFLNQDPTKAMTYRDRDFRIAPGHVYLLRSYHTGGGMGYVPGQQEGYEMKNSDYALVRVTLQ